MNKRDLPSFESLLERRIIAIINCLADPQVSILSMYQPIVLCIKMRRSRAPAPNPWFLKHLACSRQSMLGLQYIYHMFHALRAQEVWLK